MIKIKRMLLSILDNSLRAVGIVSALIDLGGYAWFAATLPFVLVIPPLVMLAVVLVPLKIYSSERWLLVVLATIYTASYAGGGFNFVLTHDHNLMPFLLELTLLAYFFARAIFLKQASVARM